MNEAEAEKLCKKILKIADIKVGGSRKQDIKVHNKSLYARVLKNGTLGLGEGYMDGDWDANHLDSFVTQALSANIDEKIKPTFKLVTQLAKAKLLNFQSSGRAYKNARAHYDIGNDLYQPMLGPTMAYSCGYWDKGAKTLDQAQIAKYQLICNKLGLKRGMKLLDVGCGWGGLIKYAVENYKVEAIGITPALEQVKYLRTIGNSKLKPIMTSYEDYKTNIQFDRIVSVGMFEHVGPKNYKKFFTKMEGLLKDEGLMLLHTIGTNKSTLRNDKWIEKYIFPGGVLPSVKQIATAIEGRFILEDWHNFGANYDKTLMAWYSNFKKSYSKLNHDIYDKRFYRMWEFYLLVCAGTFRARKNQLWQIVLSKNGVLGGYKSIR